MKHPDQQCVNLSKPEELIYWARKLNVKPLHLLHAVKVTGSNLLNRMIWYLKAEGLVPHHFEPR
ncbi:MAG TPA: DUF3606 domain-containing protein [Chitinophagaceae bacterium]